MSKQPLFDKVSRYEYELIFKIADRAIKVARGLGIDYTDKTTVVMDLAATHATIGLQLDRLLAADPGTFNHDVFGIHCHIDRRTGNLLDCFLPRTALPQKGVVS